MASFVGIQRIWEQLEALRVQEQDALSFLNSRCSPCFHGQVVRLISRVREDTHRLNAILRDALAEGKEYVRWTELQETESESSTGKVEKNNVIEFRLPRCGFSDPNRKRNH